MIRILKAMLNALWISFLFALCLIIIGVSYWPMLIASEMMLVVLFSLLCWKLTVFRDALDGIKALLGLEIGTYAGPRHTYPIRSQEDVKHALRLVGRAENPEAVKRKVIAIAQHNGYTLPEELTSEVGPGQPPISPYTGEPYDPAWGTVIQKGGQSNRALLKLMKKCETMIEQRQSQAEQEEMLFAPADWQKKD